MTTTKTAFDPFSVTLLITSDPNLYYARSSDGYGIYAVVLTGEAAAVCSCAAGGFGVPCRHRQAALARFPYMRYTDEPTEAQWVALLEKIETEAELDEVEALFAA